MVEKPVDERQTLIDAIKGDENAFGVLYENYVERIYTYIYYRTGNRYDAEDLTSRVFQRALKHIGRYKDQGLPISAWLYRIAHNLIANWYRDNKRRKEIPLDNGIIYIGSRDHPERTLQQMEEQHELLAFVRQLPPERQQLIILKFVENLSNSEIGEIMGKTEGAVKSLYHRTLLTMRDHFK